VSSRVDVVTMLTTEGVASCAIVWIASVQLGWHYAADGLGGAAGMIALWALADRVEEWLGRPQPI